MAFLLFAIENEYTNDSGEPCSLDDHLAYLRKWGGSADNFDIAESLSEAEELADVVYFDAVVVEDLDYNVVYESVD